MEPKKDKTLVEEIVETMNNLQPGSAVNNDGIITINDGETFKDAIDMLEIEDD